MKRWIAMSILGALGILATASCGGMTSLWDDDKDTDPEVGSSLAGLQAVDGCDDLLAALKERSLDEMRTLIDANEDRMLAAMDGDECDTWAGGMEDDGATPGANEKGDEASKYSTTNNQVAGVDEADFVKNDGGYIYILADGRFQIIDAWPAADAERIASYAIEGEPKKMFVYNDRALVYSSLEYLDQGGGSYPDQGYSDSSSMECTYGYDCEFTGDGRKAKITVLDIADRSAPKLLREIEFSGSYLSSRRIDDAVYSVITFPEVIFVGLAYWPEELASYQWWCNWDGNQAFPYSEWEVRDLFDELREKNAEIIISSDITDFLPGIEDTRYIEGQPVKDTGLLESCDNFYLAQAGDGQSLLSLVSLDIDALDVLNATTVVGKPGAVYSSAGALYVAVRHYSEMMDGWYYGAAEGVDEATTVHKFSLEPAAFRSTYAGSGVVKGRVLNQFSMDEHEGDLRIATTTGYLPSPDVHSTISILAPKHNALEVVGELDGIAPAEDIRSARFDGDLGFIVTFKKTDPLFVIDLSDPSAPAIKGELKIPGFSTYMHLMDDTHLLSIGYDASDQGDFAWFTGIQLQIMDVSDVSNPKLLHKEVIGTRGSTSEATTNHLAFNYYNFEGQDLLAIPMVICEGGDGDGNYAYDLTFSGLLVYDVGVDSGFERLGGVPHAKPVSGEDYWSVCGNWWTNSNSDVKRSVFMEDFIYSIALDKIAIATLDDLGQPLVTIDLLAD